MTEFANRLFSGGFDSRQAGDIILWMASVYHYNAVDGMAILEDVYKERQAEEEVGDMKPAEYRSYIAHLERTIKDLNYHIYLMAQLGGLYHERPTAKAGTRKIGVIID